MITPTPEAMLRFTSGLAAGLTASDAQDSLRALAGELRDAFGVDAVTVVVYRSGEQSLVGCPAEIEPLARMQHQVCEGPSHEAATSGLAIAVPDLSARVHDWPTYVPLAIRGGVRAALAVPLRMDDQTAGALTLYCSSVRECTEEEKAFAVAMADLFSGYFASSQAYREQQVLARQLQGALDSRVRIEQAKGVLSASERISIAEAFDRIRSYARSHHRSVDSVAQQIVEGDLRP